MYSTVRGGVGRARGPVGRSPSRAAMPHASLSRMTCLMLAEATAQQWSAAQAGRGREGERERGREGGRERPIMLYASSMKAVGVLVLQELDAHAVEGQGGEHVELERLVPADSIDIAVIVRTKFSRRENPVRR